VGSDELWFVVAENARRQVTGAIGQSGRPPVFDWFEYARRQGGPGVPKVDDYMRMELEQRADQCGVLLGLEVVYEGVEVLSVLQQRLFVEAEPRKHSVREAHAVGALGA